MSSTRARPSAESGPVAALEGVRVPKLTTSTSPQVPALVDFVIWGRAAHSRNDATHVYTVHMGRIIVEQIVSADGLAQDSEAGMKFMTVAEPDDADDDQLRMLKGVDAIVFGRTTYGMFADYWPDADPERYPVAVPIEALPKHVVSSTLEVAPWADGEIAVEAGDGVESLRRLRKRYAGDLIIWGSLTLTDALFRAGEVDVLRLRIVPTLIGAGRGPTPEDLPLTGITLVGTRVFAGGQVTLEYALER